jgi:hypothetical protein
MQADFLEKFGLSYSPRENPVLDTDNTESTDFFRMQGKTIRPFRGIRVQEFLLRDFKKTLLENRD